MVQTKTRLTISPTVGLIDTPLSITVEEVDPQARVTISARVEGATSWRSQATFEADETGSIDLARHQPLSGSYERVDPNGLIWALIPEVATERRQSIGDGLQSFRIDFALEANGEILATQEIERLAIDPSVESVELRDDIKANVFLPEGEGPHPTVLVLAGSGGGFPDATAALLASHGYAAVSLAYFGVDGLPNDLANIPLEYFENALAWIEDRQDLDSNRLVVLGTSRGGELALLLGSRYQQIRGVIAYVPSGFLWGAVSADNREDSGSDFPSWSYRGEPLPYVARVRNIDQQANADGSISFTPAFLRFIEEGARAEAATIPVENINGPVLLLSGDADDLWPSSHFSNLIKERLKLRGFDFAVESHIYPGAGHSIGVPFLPTTTNSGVHPVRGIVINLGGSPTANAKAREESWARVLAFLARHFGSKVS